MDIVRCFSVFLQQLDFFLRRRSLFLSLMKHVVCGVQHGEELLSFEEQREEVLQLWGVRGEQQQQRE